MFVAAAAIVWAVWPARAENYLLPTAIVPPGHVEMLLEYRYTRVRSNLAQIQDPRFDGFFKTSSSIAEVSIGAGVYPALQVAVRFPYIFLERGHRQITGQPNSRTEDRTGTGDPTFAALYRILDEGTFHPTIAVEAAVKPDLSSDGQPNSATGKRGGGGSGTLDVEIGVVASKTWGDWTPYATAVVLDRGETNEGLGRSGAWGGSLGTEYHWTPSLTVDVEVSARHIGHDEVDDTGGRETYRARARAYYSVWKNLSVIPSLAFIRTSAYDSEISSGIRNENNRGYEAGLGLYAVY